MSNYKYTVQITPSTPQIVQSFVKTIVNDFKAEAHWDKNVGRITFECDVQALNGESESGDPLLVQRIKRAEAEIKAAMQAATDAGLSVNWVSIGPNGNRQLIADPTLIITRTY